MLLQLLSGALNWNAGGVITTVKNNTMFCRHDCTKFTTLNFWWVRFRFRQKTRAKIILQIIKTSYGAVTDTINRIRNNNSRVTGQNYIGGIGRFFPFRGAREEKNYFVVRRRKSALSNADILTTIVLYIFFLFLYINILAYKFSMEMWPLAGWEYISLIPEFNCPCPYF